MVDTVMVPLMPGGGPIPGGMPRGGGGIPGGGIPGGGIPRPIIGRGIPGGGIRPEGRHYYPNTRARTLTRHWHARWRAWRHHPSRRKIVCLWTRS